MAKIENESETAPTSEQRFEVAVSFNGLDRGATFTHEPDEWTAYFVGTGYLKEVPDVRSEEGPR